MKRCLSLLIAVAMLLPALPATVAGARNRRGAIEVRHQKISHPAHRTHKAKHKHKHRHKRHKQHHKSRHRKSNHQKSLHRIRRRPATASDSCPNANLNPKPSNLDSIRAATLCLVNGERARFGEVALIEDTHLLGAATGHSQDMVDHHYFEHVSPTGQTLLMRVRASGFIPNSHVGYELGENIAWGTLWLGTPRAIVRAWMESPGHRANILDGTYRYSGIGVDPEVSGGQAGGMYTQDFGAIVG